MSRMFLLLLVAMLGGSAVAVSAQQATPVADAMSAAQIFFIIESPPGDFAIKLEEGNGSPDTIEVVNDTDVAHWIQIQRGRMPISRTSLYPNAVMFHRFESTGDYILVLLPQGLEIEINV